MTSISCVSSAVAIRSNTETHLSARIASRRCSVFYSSEPIAPDAPAGGKLHRGNRVYTLLQWKELKPGGRSVHTSDGHSPQTRKGEQRIGIRQCLDSVCQISSFDPANKCRKDSPTYRQAYNRTGRRPGQTDRQAKCLAKDNFDE